MPTLVAVITQEEVEPTLLPNPNLTMAIPSLAAVTIPKIPPKKLLQRTMMSSGKMDPTRMAAAGPKTKKIQVPGHYRASSKVRPHTRIVKDADAKKKETKKPKSKKKNGKPNLSAFVKVKDDCKESLQLAHSLHIEEMRNLMNSFKK
jgi:hypothetical protein